MSSPDSSSRSQSQHIRATCEPYRNKRTVLGKADREKGVKRRALQPPEKEGGVLLLKAETAIFLQEAPPSSKAEDCRPSADALAWRDTVL